MSDLAVRAAALGKRFGSTRAVDDVTLDVPRGASFAVVGPNGAGKTTLFSLAAGFLRPTAGSLVVLGRAPGSRALKGRVSILPQDARFLRHVPLGAQLAFHARLLGRDRAAAEREADRALDLVGLREVRGAGPETLSHGLYKRAALAQALLGDPELLLLDEPTAGLDPASARAVRDLLRSMRGARTLLVSSHVLAEIEDLCASIAILDRGRVVEHGSIETFLERDRCLTLTLDGDAPAPAAALRALAGVRDVETLDRPGERRVVVTLDPRADPAEVQVALVRALADRGCVPRSLVRGRPLEDRVLEATRR